jgi:multiple sugar transport system permease protein
MKTKRGRELTFSYLALAPAMVIVICFALFPAMYAIYLSFYRSNFLVFHRQFVGFDNYVYVLSNSEFWLALWKTAVYTFWCVLLQFLFGFTLAIALNKKMFGRAFLPCLHCIAVDSFPGNHRDPCHHYVRSVLQWPS